MFILAVLSFVSLVFLGLTVFLHVDMDKKVLQLMTYNREVQLCIRELRELGNEIFFFETCVIKEEKEQESMRERRLKALSRLDRKFETE